MIELTAAISEDGQTSPALERRLSKAESRLESVKGSYAALTGESVPGLSGTCELPEYVTWLSDAQAAIASGVETGIVSSQPSVSRDVSGSCTGTFEFTPAYLEGNRCATAPSISLRADGTNGPNVYTEMTYYEGVQTTEGIFMCRYWSLSTISVLIQLTLRPVQ